MGGLVKILGADSIAVAGLKLIGRGNPCVRESDAAVEEARRNGLSQSKRNSIGDRVGIKIHRRLASACKVGISQLDRDEAGQGVFGAVETDLAAALAGSEKIYDVSHKRDPRVGGCSVQRDRIEREGEENDASR